MKTKTPKSRVMWAIYDSGRDPVVSGNRSLIRICEKNAGIKAVRVAVIPLDDLAGIAERARSAFWVNGPQGKVRDIDGIRAALTAAGIPCKQRRARNTKAQPDAQTSDVKTLPKGSCASWLWRLVRRLGCLVLGCGGVCRDGAWCCSTCGKTLNYHDN